ncbi:DMT family transporter [Candidatus Bathyarchaeota archaeon]|nr:DMT family transporter [Candidatus Bathyarchaeota archaeon]
MPERARKVALIEGIMAGTFFGTAAVFIRFLGDLDVFSIAFWRLIVAGVALATLLVFLKESFSFKLVRKNLRDLFVLSVFLGLHFIFFISSVEDTTILNATVLVNTTPIFSMLVSIFLFNAKPSRLAVIGLTICFLGVCTIACADVYHFGFSLSLKGDLEAVLAAVVEAFYLNFGRKTRRQMPVLSTMFPIYLLAALLIGVLGILTYNVPTIPNNIETIIPIIGLGLLPTAIAHTLYFSSLFNLKSFETATMALLEPIGATILGVMIFQEMPTLPLIGGASLIVLGITFVVKERN